MRIPQAQRQTFASGVVRPGRNVRLSDIGAAAAPAQALARGLSSIIGAGIQIQNKIKQDEFRANTAKAEELKVTRDGQYAQAFRDTSGLPEVIKDPSILQEKLDERINEIDSSPIFQDQADLVKQELKINKLRWNNKLRSSVFARQQDLHQDNQIASIDSIQSGLELKALTSTEDFGVITNEWRLAHARLTAAGVLPSNRAQEIGEKGFHSLALNRVQQFINEGEITAAKAFIKQKDVQKMLGASGVQAANNAIQSQIKRSQSIKQNTLRLRFTDPYKYIEKIGVQLPQTIEFSDVESIEGAVYARQENIEKTDKTLGTSLPFLTPLEEVGMLNFFQKANPANAAFAIREIASKIPEDKRNQILSQIGDQLFQKDKSIGLAFQIAAEDHGTAQNLIQGGKLRQEKTLNLPSNSVLNQGIIDQLGNALPQGIAREALISGAKDLYALEMFKANDTTGVVNGETLKLSVQKLVGPVHTHNNRKTLGYRITETDKNKRTITRFVTEDEFEHTVDSLTDDILIKTQGSLPMDAKGDALSVDDIEDAQLHFVETNKYMIYINDQFAVTEKGQPYILDLAKAHEKVEPRGFLQKFIEDIF